MTGFIALQREAINHPLFKGEPARLGAWCWLLAKAAWTEIPFDISGKIITLDRGQLCVSRAQLAEAWSMSPSAVERFLSRLQSEAMIERQTDKGKSVITIMNYSKYQDIGGRQIRAKGDNVTRTGGRSKTGQETGQASLDLNVDEQTINQVENSEAGQATGQRSDSHRTTKEPLNHITTLEEETYVSPSLGAGEGESGDGDAPAAKPKRKVKPKLETADVEIPDWMPMEAWNGYLEMRAACRKSPTGRAVQLLIKKLDGFRAKGHDPTAVLDKSTIEQWTDVYELKGQGNGTANRGGAASAGNNGSGGHRGLTVAQQELARIRSAELAEQDRRRDSGGDEGSGVLPLAGPGDVSRW